MGTFILTFIADYVMNQEGYIYILTNPSFPKYIKIGYADNVEERVKQLNRSECIPFAFRIYAYYTVKERLSDKKLHNLIDKLNPNLRAVDEFDGKKRVREFYEMTPEDAYSILETIADMNGLRENLVKVKPSLNQLKDEKIAKGEHKKGNQNNLPKCSINNEEVIEVYITNNEYNAKGLYSNGEVIILEGSKIREKTSISFSDSNKKLREEFINNHVIENGVFVKNSRSLKPSAASSVIIGTSSSGNESWKTKSGVKLGNILKKNN